MFPPRIPLRRRIYLDYLPRVYTLPKQPCPSRLFTQNSQLLLISPASPRPQLPFLHTPALRPPRALTRNRFQTQILRLLTTERKRYFKDQVKLAIKYTLYFWTAMGLITIVRFGIENERLERKYPSPREWSWVSRWHYRTTRGEEVYDPNGPGLINWPNVGESYKQIIQRLEDVTVDGKGLLPQLEEEGDIYVEGVGKTGLDISSKSEPWRRGYHECLMGAARAAEHLDTWVRDTTRNIAFPPEVVIGPSNPRPRPVPFGAESAPREENCEPAFESPATYYLKILTTRGFTTRQRLDAALAYADWLDFKGLPSSAEDMYNWGLDIAMGALPTGVNNVVDTQTGIINEDATYITPNLLLATTSLASHHAQNNNFSTALPIFLSVLRAQQKLPLPPAPPPDPSTADISGPSSIFTSALSLIRSTLTPPDYPPAPPNGDLPATRTLGTPCEEAATMAHIGEILFASSSLAPIPKSSSYSHHSSPSTEPSNLVGLSWTRSSVSRAESTLRELSSGSSSSATSLAARQRCAECLEMGMENWAKMVAILRRREEEKAARGEKTTEEKQSSRGWFWNRKDGAQEEGEGAGEGEGRWEREQRVVEEKAKEVRRLLREEGVGSKGKKEEWR